MDEPTQAQDAKQKLKLLEFINSFRQSNRILLLVTHDVEFAVQAMDRLLILSKGQLIADGTPRQILSRPELLQSARLLPPQLTRFAHQLAENIPDFPKDLIQLEDVVFAVSKLMESKR